MSLAIFGSTGRTDSRVLREAIRRGRLGQIKSGGIEIEVPIEKA